MKINQDMVNKTNPNKPTPAMGDELDVYEAIYDIENKNGKKLLSPDKIEKLISAGRIQRRSKELFVNNSDESRLKIKIENFVNIVVEAMVDDLRGVVKKTFKVGETNDDKLGLNHFVYILFKREYGVDPTSFKKWLIDKHLEKVGGNYA